MSKAAMVWTSVVDRLNERLTFRSEAPVLYQAKTGANEIIPKLPVQVRRNAVGLRVWATLEH